MTTTGWGGPFCRGGYIAIAKAFHDHIWSNDAPRALFRLRDFRWRPSSRRGTCNLTRRKPEAEGMKVNEPLCHRLGPDDDGLRRRMGVLAGSRIGIPGIRVRRSCYRPFSCLRRL